MNFSFKSSGWKTFLFLILAALSHDGFSYIHNFETTRLKSTGGAGAASMLVEEATLLNPASIAFFEITSIYFQKANVQTTKNDRDTTDNDQIGFVVSDSNPSISGSLSYLNHSEGDGKRKRFSISAATSLGKSSAMGIAYRITKDKYFDHGLETSKDDFNQVVLGVTHAINESLSFGVVVNDPQKKRKEDSTYILGMQYVYAGFLSLMADAGAPLSKTGTTQLFYKMALQFKILDDFYFRVGTFNDKFLGEKGNGIGLGWVQPKLGIELAAKNTTNFARPELSRQKSSIKDASLSLSFRF